MGAGGKVTKARERPKVVATIPGCVITVTSTLASREGVTMCIVIVVVVVIAAIICVVILVVTAAIVSIPVVVVTAAVVILVVIVIAVISKLTPGPVSTVAILWEYSRDTAANISGENTALDSRFCLSPKE